MKKIYIAFSKIFLSWSDEEIEERRKSARHVALQANWKDFFQVYLKAYDKALAVARERVEKLIRIDYRVEKKYVFAGTVSTQPHFRTFTAVVNLPLKIDRLRELAYNLWWTWHPKARSLYICLDPKMWPEMGNNPGQDAGDRIAGKVDGGIGKSRAI